MGYRKKVLQNYFQEINKHKHIHINHNRQSKNEKFKIQIFNSYVDRALERLRKLLCFISIRKVSVATIPNCTNSLTMHNKLQLSILHAALFSIKLLPYSSVIYIPSLLFCSDIHSLAIIVSICDISH